MEAVGDIEETMIMEEAIEEEEAQVADIEEIMIMEAQEEAHHGKPKNLILAGKKPKQVEADGIKTKVLQIRLPLLKMLMAGTTMIRKIRK